MPMHLITSCLAAGSWRLEEFASLAHRTAIDASAVDASSPDCHGRLQRAKLKVGSITTVPVFRFCHPFASTGGVH